MAVLRLQGVHGANLPTKKSNTIVPSDFSIAGIVLRALRQYEQSWLLEKGEDYKEVFGEENSAFYGSQALTGLFQNSGGAKVWVKSHIGNTGSARDAANAVSTINDATPSATLIANDAYKTIKSYGAYGNKTGYKVTNGDRFSTTFAATALASATTVTLSSNIGVFVGDIMKFSLTGGSPVTVYKKITALDQNAKTVTFSGALHGSSTATIGDAATVIGFRVQTYKKDQNGVQTEVEIQMGKVFCTMEPEVTQYYVQNVFAENKFMNLTDQSSSSVLQLSFPADTAIVYLASGADGTAPTTQAHWDFNNSALDGLDFRWITNPETTNSTVIMSLENYCNQREDSPVVIGTTQGNQTKSQLQVFGQNIQRGNEVDAIILGDWLTIPDPFSGGGTPDRPIPAVGHFIGSWISVIRQRGIHYTPAISDFPISGVTGIYRTTAAFSDQDRTDIANSGVNIIQKRNGIGVQVRNAYTLSTSTEFQNGNGVIMRNFIKLSSTESLQGSENTPNALSQINNDRSAILKFMYDLWDKGSTGNVPTGETFGQEQDSSGNPTKPEDHFSVESGPSVNPQASLNAGNRNHNIYFTYPAPAGSIQIGVGIILRS